MTDRLAPFAYNATVLTVQDGDTINVRIDWGFRRYDEPIPVRIVGIAARELAEPGGKEARANLAALLPPGTPLLLTTAKPDKYNPRWDADVAWSGGNLGARLLLDGWAVPWDGRGRQPKPPWPRETAA